MHEHRIVHGDIKPANIHANPAHPVESVQLIDLGMAIDVDRWSLPNGPLRSPGGTQPYMPPEQLTTGQADGRLCDIYSLGGVLFFLLTGEPPYDPISASRGLRATKAPRLLKEVAHRALAANPAERTVSAREMAGQLQKYLAQHALMQTARKLAVPLVSAVVIGLGALGLGRSKTPEYMVSYLPAADQLLENTARDLDIDLNKITHKDLRVSLTPNEGYGGLSFVAGVQTMQFPALLTVEAESPLKELLSNVEVRVGKQPWRNFLVQSESLGKSHYVMLTAADVNAGGPIQLRLDSIGGVGVGQVFGPYSYDINLLDEFKRCQLSKKAAVARDWIVSQQPWISSFRSGWELREDKFQFPWTPVKQLRLRSEVAEETVINFMQEPDPRNRLEMLVGYPHFRHFEELREAFRNAAKPHHKARHLDANLVFFDDSESPTMRFENAHDETGEQQRLRVDPGSQFWGNEA